MLDIIRNHQEEIEKPGVPFEVIRDKSEKSGIEEKFVKQVLEREKKRGGLYEPIKDHFKLTE